MSKHASDIMELSISLPTGELRACRPALPLGSVEQIYDIAESPEPRKRALPNELFLKVCEYADFETSKKLRCVDSVMSVFACQGVFAEVYATALPEQLENLRKIANNPDVARHVKKITYVIDRLNPHLLKFQNWKAAVAHVSPGPVSDEMRAKYNRYRQLYDEQRALTLGMEETSILAECIPLFMNIQDFEMVKESWIFRNPAFTGGTRPILSSLFKDTLIHGAKLFDDGHPVERRLAMPHIAMINASASVGKSMNTLILDHLPWGFWAKAGYTPLFLEVESSLAAAFANLKVLRLTTWLGTMGVTEDRKSPMCHFINFLSAAPNLQHLDFTLTPLNALGVAFFNQADINLTDMFEKLTWPKLLTFDIGKCMVDRDAFIAFMNRHKETLKHVIICSMELIEPHIKINNSDDQQDIDDRDASLVGTRPGESWAVAVKCLAPILKLCHARLSLLIDAYILRRSGAQYAGQGGVDPQEYPRKHAYCRELTEYLVYGGNNNNCDLPVYGSPASRCVCCDCRTEEMESSDEDSDDIDE